MSVVAHGRKARLGDGFLPYPFKVLRGFFRMSFVVHSDRREGGDVVLCRHFRGGNKFTRCKISPSGLRGVSR